MNINKKIQAFKEMQEKMLVGEAYYKKENTEINKREKEFYSTISRRTIRDFTKANHRLASGFTKLIVDQKIYYSINKNMDIEGIENYLDEDAFRKQLRKVAKDAANKYYGLLYWYIENGKLKYKKLQPEQCIIVHNDDDNVVIDKVIRFYEENKVHYAEVYGVESIDLFELEGSEYKLKSTMPYMVKTTQANGNVLSQDVVSWGVVPITVLYNNDEHQRDLDMFKTDVDMYDVVKSDLGNNLEDYQEMYWVLKGYEGQDPEQFMQEFKRSRILKVGAEGDVNQIAQEVPYEARKETLEILRKDIYRFGMAVDPEAIKGDTTNVTIKALFANLDLKANGFEEQIEEFISSIVPIINKYAEITNKPALDKVVVNFERSTIINRSELIKMLNESGVRVSQSTLLKNHPLVEDNEEELKLIDQENALNPLRLGDVE